MQDIAKVAIPGKILMAAWAVTGGVTQFAVTKRAGVKREGEFEAECSHQLKKLREEQRLLSGTSVHGVAADMVTGNDIVDLPIESGNHLKATKRDDAEVPTEMWRYLLTGRIPQSGSKVFRG